MTDETTAHDETETTETTTAHRSFREWLADLARSLWTPTRTRPIALIFAGVLVLIGGIYLLNRQGSEADARIAAVTTLNAQNLYIVELQAWSDKVAAHDLCVDSVARSLDNRSGWQQLSDILTAAQLPEYAAQIEAGPVLSKTPRTTDECPLPGPRPDPPAGFALTDVPTLTSTGG